MNMCEYFRRQISRNMDGNLTPQERAELSVHLSHSLVCTDCQKVLSDYRRIRELLRNENTLEAAEP